MPRATPSTDPQSQPLIQTERDLIIRLDEKFAQIITTMAELKTSFTTEIADMKNTATIQMTKMDARIVALEVFREKTQVEQKISHWDEAYDAYIFQKKTRVLIWSIIGAVGGVTSFLIQELIYYMLNIKKG